MGQYTILLNNATKQLIATNRINLRQHENIVDKLTFVVPFQYTESIDLRKFNVVLEWLDPTNVAHMDVLEKEEEIYKDNYQRYFLPVESPLNRFAGDIEMKLVFTMVDYETSKRYKLETDTIIVPIMSIKDYYAVMPSESFDAINDTIDELRAISDKLTADAQLFYDTKGDDLGFDEEGTLHLTAHGEIIGQGVDVATPGTEDDEDESHDGIINADEIYKEIKL